MRPTADRIADAAAEPRESETPPVPTLVAPPPADDPDELDDDDFSGPLAAW